MTSLLKRLLRFLNSYFFYKCTFSIKYTVMWCSSSYTSHWKSKQIMKSAAWLISTLHSQQLDWFLHCILSSLIEFFHVIYLASLQYSLAWSITNSIARSISTQSISMQLISNFYTINFYILYVQLHDQFLSVECSAAWLIANSIARSISMQSISMQSISTWPISTWSISMWSISTWSISTWSICMTYICSNCYD